MEFNRSMIPSVRNNSLMIFIFIISNFNLPSLLLYECIESAEAGWLCSAEHA